MFVLLWMYFMHILDDFVLQAPCLCNLKQKSWWEKQTEDTFYKYDYLIGLFIHSFSWSFMIMFPIAYQINFKIDGLFCALFLFNLILHFFIDNLKANKYKINLIIDQFLHSLQIIITWYFYIFIYYGLYLIQLGG